MMNNKEQDKNCAPAARQLWKRYMMNKLVQNLVDENIVGNGKRNTREIERYREYK
jgi:hypothetical protein